MIEFGYGVGCIYKKNGKYFFQMGFV